MYGFLYGENVTHCILNSLINEKSSHFNSSVGSKNDWFSSFRCQVYLKFLMSSSTQVVVGSRVFVVYLKFLMSSSTLVTVWSQGFVFVFYIKFLMRCVHDSDNKNNFSKVLVGSQEWAIQRMLLSVSSFFYLKATIHCVTF